MKNIAILSSSALLALVLGPGRALATDCGATLLRSVDGSARVVGTIQATDVRAAVVENDRGVALQRISIARAPKGSLTRQFSVAVGFRIVEGEPLRVRWVDAHAETVCKAPLIDGSLVPADGSPTEVPQDKPVAMPTLEPMNGVVRQAEADLSRRASRDGARRASTDFVYGDGAKDGSGDGSDGSGDGSDGSGTSDDTGGSGDGSDGSGTSDDTGGSDGKGYDGSKGLAADASDGLAIAGSEDFSELSYPSICTLHSVKVSRTSISVLHAFPSPLYAQGNLGPAVHARGAYVEVRNAAGVILTSLPARLLPLVPCRRSLFIANTAMPAMDLGVGDKLLVDLVVTFSAQTCPSNCSTHIIRARYSVPVL